MQIHVFDIKKEDNRQTIKTQRDLDISRFTQYEVSIRLHPVKLHKIKYRRLQILKFEIILILIATVTKF